MKFMKSRNFLLTVLIILVNITTGAFAQSAADGFKPSVTGSVFDVTLGQGNYKYVIGNFTQVNGTARNYLARLNNDGSLDTTYNPAPNTPLQAIAITDNKAIVVGGFSSIGGGASGGIARLNFNGTNDGTFTASISGAGSVAIQPDGKVVVGGGFSTVNGVPRSNLARFNTDGTLDTTFVPNINNSVFGVTIQPDGKILIAGQFTVVDGQNKFSFARLNSDGSLDAGFAASLTHPGANGSTDAVAVQADGKVIVVGNFTRFGDLVTPRNRIVRLNIDGSVDPTFTPSFDDRTLDVKIQSDGKIVVGGRFTTVNGATRAGIARINMNGQVDTSFVTNTSASVPAGYSIQGFAVQSDGAIVIGGEFTEVNGSTGYNKLARLYPDGRLDADTVLTITGGPATTMISLPNGQTLLGGGFTNVGGAARQGMARIGWTGANDSSFANPQLTGWVYGIAVLADGKYIAGGDFTSAGGGSQAKLARILTNGTVDASFAPTFNAGGWVNAVAVQPDGKIIIVGGFTTVNGTPRNRVARLNASGSLDTTFNPNADQPPQVIALQSDGKIVIGGAFENVGGLPRVALARLNSDGSVDTSFNPIIGGIPLHEVYEITIDRNSALLVGGRFSSVNGTPRSSMARIHTSGELDLNFVPPTIDGSVLKIVPDLQQTYYIAGRFLNVGGVPSAGVARITDIGQVVGFPNTGANDVLSMTRRSDNKILLSGYFTTVSGQPRAQFAALRGFFGALSEIYAYSSSIIWVRGTQESEITRAVFERSTDGVNYTFLGNGTRGQYGDWGLNIPDADATGYIRVRGYTDDFSVHKSVYEKVVYVARPTRRAGPFDFDGDGKTDLGIFRPGVGEWWINPSSGGLTYAMQFGSSTDRIVPADYTGDGKTDVAVFRPSNGRWYILRSGDSTYYDIPFGTSTDIPVPADFDNDGKADPAVFRPSTSTWYIQRSTDNGTTIEGFGSNGDIPVASDYDGDGRADLAIFRPGPGQWWLKRSTAGVIVFTFGASTDKLVQGDYTGDGKSDVALWRPSNGQWYILRSEDPASFYSVPFGTTSDIPAPGDYDGDGKFDTAIFRPSSATWYCQKSGGGTLIQQFGLSSDRPIPNAFVP
jgi:uncharacterized delta-60 repeat protein